MEISELMASSRDNVQQGSFPQVDQLSRVRFLHRHLTSGDSVRAEMSVH